jgi:hypothetical protein
VRERHLAQNNTPWECTHIGKAKTKKVKEGLTNQKYSA